MMPLLFLMSAHPSAQVYATSWDTLGGQTQMEVLRVAPHAEHFEAHRFAEVPSRAPQPLNEGELAKFPLTKGSQDLIVYGYLPYWEQDADIPWQDLTHLGYFSAEISSTGAITGSHGWGGASQLALVEEAHSYGVRVDLVVTLFDPEFRKLRTCSRPKEESF